PTHREAHDFVRDKWLQFFDAMQLARDELVTGLRALESTFRPAARYVDPNARCCVSHLRIGVRVAAWEGRKTAMRCRWCYDRGPHGLHELWVRANEVEEARREAIVRLMRAPGSSRA